MTFDPLSSFSSSEDGVSVSWGASFAAASLASASFVSAAICRFVNIYTRLACKRNVDFGGPGHLSSNSLCNNSFG
jgi:hypothetical protein